MLFQYTAQNFFVNPIIPRKLIHVVYFHADFAVSTLFIPTTEVSLIIDGDISSIHRGFLVLIASFHVINWELTLAELLDDVITEEIREIVVD